MRISCGVSVQALTSFTQPQMGLHVQKHGRAFIDGGTGDLGRGRHIFPLVRGYNEE